jgi:hypothetical protein
MLSQGDIVEVHETRDHTERSTSFVRVRITCKEKNLIGWTTHKFRGKELMVHLPPPVELVVDDELSAVDGPSAVEVVTGVRFGLLHLGKVFATLDEVIDAHPIVANDQSLMEIVAQYDRPLAPGAIHTFSVVFEGDEESVVSIESMPFHAASGRDVKIVLLDRVSAATGPSPASTHVTSTHAGVNLSWSPALCGTAGVKVGYRILTALDAGKLVEHFDREGEGKDSRPLALAAKKDSRILLAHGIEDCVIHDLAPWTPYIFTVAGINTDGETLTSHESKVFVYTPPSDLPVPAVRVGSTNQTLVVSLDDVDTSQYPEFEKLFTVISHQGNDGVVVYPFRLESIQQDAEVGIEEGNFTAIEFFHFFGQDFIGMLV